MKQRRKKIIKKLRDTKGGRPYQNRVYKSIHICKKEDKVKKEEAKEHDSQEINVRVHQEEFNDTPQKRRRSAKIEMNKKI